MNMLVFACIRGCMCAYLYLSIHTVCVCMFMLTCIHCIYTVYIGEGPAGRGRYESVFAFRKTLEKKDENPVPPFSKL